ncbi:MAG: hypothetical protein ACLSDJ_06490 [Butyricimonas faecihominis]
MEHYRKNKCELGSYLQIPLPMQPPVMISIKLCMVYLHSYHENTGNTLGKTKDLNAFMDRKFTPGEDYS